MINLFLALLILPESSFAQTTTAPAGTSVAPVVAPVAAAPAPNPWRLSYYGEYQGPPLSNLDFQKTQTPGTEMSYVSFFHSAKVGYAFGKGVTLGTQFRALGLVDPEATNSIQFLDQRAYLQWGNMINTSALSITGRITGEFPTTDASRTRGKILAFTSLAMTEIKTPLRNWGFSFSTYIKTTFFNNPVGAGTGNTDINIGIEPNITFDVLSGVQLYTAGSFDANHNYLAQFYEYLPGDFDYIDFGSSFSVGSHLNPAVALRFFTDSFAFNSAVLFASLAISL